MPVSRYINILFSLLIFQSCVPGGRIQSVVHRPEPMAQAVLIPQTTTTTKADPRNRPDSNYLAAAMEEPEIVNFKLLSFSTKMKHRIVKANSIIQPLASLRLPEHFSPTRGHNAIKFTVRPDYEPSKSQKTWSYILIGLAILTTLAGIALTGYWVATASSFWAGFGLFFAGIIITTIVPYIFMIPAIMLIKPGRERVKEPSNKPPVEIKEEPKQ